jgi:hypothetical protein
MILARVLADVAVRIAPAKRRAWVEASRAELAHVPSKDVASFAIGIFGMALRLRLTSPPFVLVAARYGLAGAALIWAVGCLRLGLHLDSMDHALPAAAVLATAAIYGLGVLTTALAGLRVASVLILPPLLLAGLYAAGAASFSPQFPNQAFYQALATEDAITLLAALAIAVWAQRYGASELGERG